MVISTELDGYIYRTRWLYLPNSANTPINRKNLITEEQIQEWVDKAERGYDVDEPKRRGRGRPSRGATPSQVIAVRLTEEELRAVDEAATRVGLNRSDFIRRALATSSV
nr:ribbon-helix-helix protein, CopG family [Actinomyces qiguomingii]